MHCLTITTLIAFFVLATVGAKLPACADICFYKAVEQTTCNINDYYCQCTTGAKEISKFAIKCLCDTGDCSASEMIDVGIESNKICSSALAASSQTYTPSPFPANVCKAGGAAATSSGMASTSAKSTTSGGSSSGSSTSSTVNAAASSSTGSSAAAATKISVVGLEGAVLGLAGMAMLAL